MDSLWVAKTGLEAQQTRMTVVSNNLANVNTTGFKRGRAVFEDLMYQNVRQVGGSTSEDTQAPTGLLLGTGVRVVATEKMFTQGNHVETGNPLDLLVDGRGFFQVLQPDGSMAYTRDGSLKMDAEGRVVTSSGYEIQPSINLPADALGISVSQDGIVQAKVPGQADLVTVGSLQLVDFANPAGLEAMGQNLFAETVASGAPQIGTPGLEGLGRVVQGALEGSNVNVVEELVNMIETQRAYEMNSKAIAASDQMLEYLNTSL
ncbi:MAG: flagellar basal-body rod protein FlgG [Gammaproteobacteria bacterium]|nr:flagellar basal-body rod protein FlgG [Gammaproteobacteria bacterium]